MFHVIEPVYERPPAYKDHIMLVPRNGLYIQVSL